MTLYIPPLLALDVSIKTITCQNPNHYHTTPYVDVIAFTIRGHTVHIETEQDSERYNAFVDDDPGVVDVTKTELSKYLREKTQ
jgi:hypothetical protein